jgi:hexosaminidase
VSNEHATDGAVVAYQPDRLLRGEEELNLGLIPQPRSMAARPGGVVWTSPLRISVDDGWKFVVKSFAVDLQTSIGWQVEIVDSHDQPDIQIVHINDYRDEDYGLRTDQVTTIEASSAAGASYALTMLRQMGPMELWSGTRQRVEKIELPKFVINDGPKFPWRGVHLDVARHFWDVATVCRLIDQIAAHRLNKLHLHLNDDQGWRVEIPTWPRLTQVGSRRSSSPLGHEDDGVDDHVAHGGFYTANDLWTIREHAAKRCVQVIPEIDLPGHAQAVITAYSHLGNVAEPVEVWTRWGISEHVLNVGPAALDFAEEVVCYVAGLFPESPVHIGGDECPTTEWESSPLARAVMAEHGFTEARQLQGLFTNRLSAALRRDGHEVVAWDEALDADVPEGTVIMAWRGSKKGVEAAKRGLDVIMAPMELLYFDWPNSTDVGEPLSLVPPEFAISWEKVYGLSVYPPGLDTNLRRHVRGAQAQLWTEYIATRDHLDYMAFPRICAFAEVVWGTSTMVSDFRKRLVLHLERLSLMGVAYRPLDPA